MKDTEAAELTDESVISKELLLSLQLQREMKAALVKAKKDIDTALRAKPKSGNIPATA